MFIMPNGKHIGEPITRIPVSYLKWMVNNNHTYAEEAANEMKRRGTTTPTLDVSGHAIDRASQRLLKIWMETKRENEGLHSWLVKKAEEALAKGVVVEPGKYLLNDVNFVFDIDGKWPTLKTVTINSYTSSNPQISNVI